MLLWSGFDDRNRRMMIRNGFELKVVTKIKNFEKIWRKCYLRWRKRFWKSLKLDERTMYMRAKGP